jgi:hypothetical protein
MTFLYVHPVFTGLFLPYRAPPLPGRATLRAARLSLERLREAAEAAAAAGDRERQAHLSNECLREEIRLEERSRAAEHEAAGQGGLDEGLVWHTHNARHALSITSNAVVDPDDPSRRRHFGVPYGTRGRLLLAYLQTAAKRFGSPDVPLGASICNLSAALSLDRTTGGERGTLTALHDQLLRLVNCSLSVTDVLSVDGTHATTRVSHDSLAKDALLGWTRSPGGAFRVTDLERITLSDSLFTALMRPPGQGAAIPLEAAVLLHPAVRGNARAWDLYTHLRARFYRLKHTRLRRVTFPLSELAALLQMPGRLTGSGRKELLAAIERVYTAWPDFGFGGHARHRAYDLTWRDDLITLTVTKDGDRPE